MKTSKKHLLQKPPALRMLALVPHRDSRLPLRAWSSSLFESGLPGAWSFPWVSPLALLNRPLSSEELKNLARALREHVNLCGGKFIAGTPTATTLPLLTNGGSHETHIFGPELQAEFPGNFFDKISEAIISRLSPLVLGSAILSNPSHGSSLSVPLCLCEKKIQIKSLPEISFRAAALANMSFRPLLLNGEWDGVSSEWKIGKLHWLPKS